MERVVRLCKQKKAYEMRMSDWSSDVCSSDLRCHHAQVGASAAEQPSLAQGHVAAADHQYGAALQRVEKREEVHGGGEASRLNAARGRPARARDAPQFKGAHTQGAR